MPEAESHQSSFLSFFFSHLSPLLVSHRTGEMKQRTTKLSILTEKDSERANERTLADGEVGGGGWGGSVL